MMMDALETGRAVRMTLQRWRGPLSESSDGNPDHKPDRLGTTCLDGVPRPP